MLTLLSGLIASSAHVVTGPDHLAAVAPLAIDSRRKSWIIGLSWGTGHTLGMLLIGGIFILFREALPLDLISRYSDKIIGLILIGIGTWAIARTLIRHSHGDRPHTHFHTWPFIYAHSHSHAHLEMPDHEHPHDRDQVAPARQNALSALLVGIVHGFAGFSHLVALLPSLALPSLEDTFIYLAGFAAGTLLTMAGFAFLLGLLAWRSHARGQRVFLALFTLTGGVLAAGVGVLWLVHPF